jgi:MFS family permease
MGARPWSDVNPMPSWRHKSYDMLPALSVRGQELRRSLRITTIAYMYCFIWLSCVSGSHVPVFAHMLGFSDFDFGLMTAIPFLATLGQLVAAVLIERTGLKKYQFIRFGVLHRLMWIAVAAIPLVLPLPSRWAVWAMLLALMVSWSMASLSAPAWTTWMGDLIPRRIRGRYFANRAIYTRPVQVLFVIALGVVLDAVTKTNASEWSAADQPVLLRVICVIFIVGALFGAADILLFRKVREVLPTTPDRPREPVVKFDISRPSRWNLPATAVYFGRFAASAVRQLLVEPMKDRVFRRYVAYGMTITFAMAIPGWYFWKNSLENLHFTKLGANFMFLVVGPVLGLAGSKQWGKLIDRWGRRPVLLIATVGTCISVTPWFFASRGTPSPAFVVEGMNWLFAKLNAMAGRNDLALLAADSSYGAYLLGCLASVLGGVAWTGIGLAQTGIMLGFSDGPGRSKYLAASSALISIGGMVGGIAGGLIAENMGYLQGTPWQIGCLLWNNWHLTFAFSFLTRAASVFWLFNMPDPGAGRTRDMIRYVGSNLYNFMTNFMYMPMRLFGRPRGGRHDRGD